MNFKKLQRAFHTWTAGWRVLPDFIVIGAQRGGTTSLYNYLIKFPQVAWSYKKEVHYFDTHYTEGLGWYRAHFPTRTWIGINKLFGRKLVVGEATPYYMFHPLAAKRIAELLPNAKLIAVLRNPIDRAYSQYQQCAQAGRENLSFEDALDGEEERLKNDLGKLLAGEYDHIPGAYKDHPYKIYSYQARGRYAEQLERWYQHYPRENILILKAEEMYANPREVMERVSRFLGISTKPAAKMKYPKHHAGSYSTMKPETRQKLARYFQPHNKKLYALLGEDYNWEANKEL